MKTYKFRIIGLICIAAAMVFTTCMKETDFFPPDEVPSALKGAKADKYIPGDDITDQLRNDLEDGLSVTLPAGHFYLSESICILEYPGGTIKGAGRDATIIEASPGFEVPDHPLFPGTGISSMLEIHAEGDVTCKAFTILVEGDHPAEGHIYSFTGAISTNIDNVIVVIGDGISLECKDLRIKGEYVGDVDGAYNGYNISWPIVGVGAGFEHGDFNHLSVKNCEIEGIGGAGIDLWAGTTAELKDNVISNAGYGIWLLFNSGIQTVKDCHFSNISMEVFTIVEDIGPHCFKDNTLDGQLLPDDCQ